MSACAAQHRGDRAEQQDRVAVLRGRQAARCALGVLADGVGGCSGGAIAAENVVLATQNRFDVFAPDLEGPEAFFRSLVHELHTVIRVAALTAGKDPHSTFAAVLVQPDRVDWCHVGDSRVYHFRDGVPVSCTVDHTYAQRLVDEGRLTPEQARRHPHAARLANTLGSPFAPRPSLGGIADPRPGDSFLICSDGLWSYFTPGELGETIARLPAREAAGQLIDLARARAQGHGDNCSLVLFKLDRR